MCQVMADVWMGSDLKAHMAAWPCALLEHDDDYGAALPAQQPPPPGAGGGSSTAQTQLSCSLRGAAWRGDTASRAHVQRAVGNLVHACMAMLRAARANERGR